jgi:hypothetical protein
VGSEKETLGAIASFTPVRAGFARPRKPLWRCRQCGRPFANRNQSHSCGRVRLEAHFVDKTPRARALFRRLAHLVRACGPVTIVPEKSRIAFQVRMSFAAVSVRRSWLVGHLVLARRIRHPRFPRVESLSRRNHVHHFKVASLEDLDTRFVRWLREAYRVGEQKHLKRDEP